MTSHLPVTTVWRLKPGRLSWCRVGSDLVVLDEELSRYLSVNGSGAVLWEGLESGSSVSELARRLVARYGIDPDKANADTRQFLDSMRARDLIEEVG